MSESRSTHPVVTALGVVVVLAFAAACAYAVVRGAIKDPALIGSLATALGAVVAVVIGREREVRLQLRQKHRDQISPMYRELVDRLRESSDEGAQEFFKKWHTGLLLDAPADVIKAWLEWSRAIAAADFSQGQFDVPSALATEKVLLAIRKDLGHNKDSELQVGDLQRVYMNVELGDLLFGSSQGRLPRSESSGQEPSNLQEPQ